MNYADCLKELIQVCPLKKYGVDVTINWYEAEKKRDEIIALFDTELLTMANIATYNVELKSDYLLVVGTRFGVMSVLDNSDVLTVTTSYYLKSGIMYGPSTAKKTQFAFEISALANKSGIKFKDDIGKRENSGVTGQIFLQLRNVLREFYSESQTS